MALRRRTDAYWQKRAEQRLLASERTTKKYMTELRKTYAEARKRTVKSLQDIYAAYYKKDEGFDREALRSIVPNSEIKKFLAEMKKLGLKTDLPKNYTGRVNRLKLINAQLKAEAQKVGIQQQAIDRRALIEDFTDSYYRAGFDVAKGLGSTPIGFNGIDQQTVNQVLSAKFEGRNFSSRIWTNTDLLASRLRQTLAVAIANGQGISKTAAEMSRDYNVNRSYAERLIRTESNHFHNSGELEAYKQMGFTHFKFLATLDSRTSEICRDMDGRVFKVDDGIPGENVPPLHPNCRSTIVPYFKGYQPETRLYRDPETGKNEFTYNVPYNEWKESMLPSNNAEKRPEDEIATRKFEAVVKKDWAHLKASDLDPVIEDFKKNYYKKPSDDEDPRKAIRQQLQDYVFEKTGLNYQHPKIVEMFTLPDQGKIYRGVTATSADEWERYHKQFVSGKIYNKNGSNYGSGIYFTKSKRYADENYARRLLGQVYTARLTDDARILKLSPEEATTKFNLLDKLMKRFGVNDPATLLDDPGARLKTDVGLIAALTGYDAVDFGGTAERVVIVLNRSKLEVEYYDR